MMKEAQLHQPVAISEGGATVLISFATTEGQTRKIAERISANLRERGYEAKLYDTAVRRGVPEVGAFDAVIVAQAKGCDLIVMSSHGHRGLMQLMCFGSQAHRVVTHMPIKSPGLNCEREEQAP